MATVMQAPPLLTYEDYMAEPEVEGRYDIIEGVRVFMPGATLRHQRIAGNIEELLRRYERTGGTGITASAPLDVLIRRIPRLQTRQPDVLFVTHARLAQGGGIPDVGPLPVGPEIVVEIISTSETQRILQDKITDYVAVGVDECWVVRAAARTVEILRLTPDGPQSVRVYDDTQTLSSAVFPALSVPVADVFAP